MMLAGLLFVAVAFGILAGLGSSLLFNYTLIRNKHLVPGDYIYYVRGDYEFGDGAFTDIDDAVLRVLELSESSVPA